MKPETSFGLSLHTVTAPMGDIRPGWKERMRTLSNGPYEAAMWRWTYHDGSTWAACLFEGPLLVPEAMVGWACWCEQIEPHPVLGVYVHTDARGRGYAQALVSLLVNVRGRKGGKVYAVTKRFPAYAEICEAAGLEVLEWE